MQYVVLKEIVAVGTQGARFLGSVIRSWRHTVVRLIFIVVLNRYTIGLCIGGN